MLGESSVLSFPGAPPFKFTDDVEVDDVYHGALLPDEFLEQTEDIGFVVKESGAAGGRAAALYGRHVRERAPPGRVPGADHVSSRHELGDPGGRAAGTVRPARS